MSILLDLLLVLLFVLIGGIFAATEMALVSLRESQIKQFERGNKAARTVASLARDSGRFLSAVQIGVTFAGFLSSAFGASTIAPQVSPVLVGWGMAPGAADAIALVAITLLVSYFSLVLGELVPKRIAMQKAATVSLAVAPPLNIFAKLMTPLIWIVNSSSNLLLRILGFDPNARTEEMSNEEVREIVTTHEGLGDDERKLLADVFDANDMLVVEVMRHRSDIVAFEASSTVTEVAEGLVDQPYSRYPVFDGDIDNIIGFVHVRDILQHAASGHGDSVISSLMRKIAYFPSTVRVPDAMRQLRATATHIGVVIDEYGGTDGIVTLEDLLEELVGEIWDEYDSVERRAILRLHESRSFDGSMNLEDFAEATGIHLPEGSYETIAGWMLDQLGRLARADDIVPIEPDQTEDYEDDLTSNGVRYQLEVAQLNGNRIAEVKLRKTVADADDREGLEPETESETP
ncbi:hemolysin family protein [Gulosibacter molinativorax]|uniref:HlyC/CorC family transporter n=1 Tax=Gulosibacter molinativorax TaxID=256821 RepID=A0ABT7C5R3_9MICO|nr:hemolysin family protein [Gulosibacter molinativorax]MDJ1370541.1 HlyC/CorC family transporter [Gulosibacter molinativorax]QUY62046.1 Transporter associated domain protein [Gulosibacter molinativorax]